VKIGSKKSEEIWAKKEIKVNYFLSILQTGRQKIQQHCC